MFDLIRAILSYIVDLGVLVFVHELGHYLAARSQGVVVEAFSIGFGPTLMSWKAKSGTIWKISVLPLGGYVKMQGWGEANRDAPALPGSFSACSLGSKALIVAAGPLANMLLAFVLFAGLFMSVGQVVVQPVLSSILPHSPAFMAGLQPGDRVLAVDGRKIDNFTQLQNIVMAHPNGAVTMTLDRHGQVVTQPVKLGTVSEDGTKIGQLGVVGTESQLRRYSPPGAVVAAAQETYSQTTTMLSGLYRLFVHRQGLSQLAGPLGIAQISGKVAAMGFISVVNLIALLSINLGLVNLVPIPVLDGGHLLFYAAEAIYRRPLPPRAQDIGLRFGIAVILSLFFVTTLNDLTRLGAVSWVVHLFG
ncbi:MAG TPA: RIP metalloprotease RseP [Acidocella sp.]|uniref:RIP metalloprotease RseP n=1 Tax=Acidocella sp. TaxID=50710 RepID=UPI002CF67625|nr:RIP metalloprotease RseP [Acidocella sp.]HVE20362.1 RIP metalloprotease RseP [Acidocella sp.]